MHKLLNLLFTKNYYNNEIKIILTKTNIFLFLFFRSFVKPPTYLRPDVPSLGPFLFSAEKRTTKMDQGNLGFFWFISFHYISWKIGFLLLSNNFLMIKVYFALIYFLVIGFLQLSFHVDERWGLKHISYSWVELYIATI